MAYIPLRNYKYDSGDRRIQSGPNHEGFTVSSSGVMDTGADNGVIVGGTPNFYGDYNTDWRTLPYSPSGTIFDVNNTAYRPSGTLSSYTSYRTLTRTSVANSTVSDSVGADYGLIDNGRYVTLGGVSPSSQVYTPYNTPESNTAAEGYTGGGVTHRSYENGLLTNTLGSQGTNDRSQWRYSQPVYCKTYTETVRPSAPGLMSTAVRYIYRGESTRYSLNTGNVMSYASPRVEQDASIGLLSGSPLIYAPWYAPSVPNAVSYAWFADGLLIPGATESLYVPDFDLLGSRIYVNVTDRDGSLCTSKSYKSVVGYRYYLGAAVTNSSVNVYRKLTGEYQPCPGSTPDPDASPLVDTVTVTTAVPWDNVLVSVGEGSPTNNYVHEYSVGCPLGGTTTLSVFVRNYLGSTLVNSAQFDYPIDASFLQAAFKLYCVLSSVVNTDTGETLDYVGVDLV